MQVTIEKSVDKAIQKKLKSFLSVIVKPASGATILALNKKVLYMDVEELANVIEKGAVKFVPRKNCLSIAQGLIVIAGKKGTRIFSVAAGAGSVVYAFDELLDENDSKLAGERRASQGLNQASSHR